MVVGKGGTSMKEPTIVITQQILRLIARIDEFKGQWKALGKVNGFRVKLK